jgi:uncharacterized protein (TIGR03437 family)
VLTFKLSDFGLMKLCLSLLAFTFCAPAFSQQLTGISGGGQIVLEQFPSTALMTVRAVDSSGKPAPNVPVTWALTRGQGSVIERIETTNADGIATARFLGTSIQPGNSYAQTVVTATSPFGSVPFTLTTVPNRLGEQPTIQIINVAQISGPAGSTVPNAFTVVVGAGSGILLGQGIPNIGVHVVLSAEDASGTTPGGVCEGPGGYVYTDARGYATCNLILNRNVGTGGVHAITGDYHRSSGIPVTITPAAPCNFTLTPTSQNFAAAGGPGSFIISTASVCAWNVATTANWITFAGPASGTGNSTIRFNVAANSGAARTGTITTGNATFTISQSGQGVSAPLAFSSAPMLPAASIGTSYSTTLNVTGGQPPYVWNATGLPAGVSLNSSTGLLSGVITTAGTFNIAVRVQDAAGTFVTGSFALTAQLSPPGSGPISFTTASLPAGTPGIAYLQAIEIAGGCRNPFAGPRIELASGSLPPGLSLVTNSNGAMMTGIPTAVGTFQFALRASDPCGASITRDFTITISTQSAAPALTINPGRLSFTYQLGGSVPAEQTLAIATGDTKIDFSVAAVSAGNWLAVVDPSGTTPATVRVRIANPGQLQPQTYQGSLTFTSQASNSPVTLPVSLIVTAAAPAVSANPSTLTFDTEIGTPLPQTLSIALAANPAVNVTTAAATKTGGQWLSVSPGSVSAPGRISVSVNAQGLQTGTYSGSITISAAGAPQAATILVTLNVTQPGPHLSSLTNGASFLPGPNSPGEIITIKGVNLGPVNPATLALTAAGTIATTLSDVRVWFDEQPAPLLYVSFGQINAIVPYAISGRQFVKLQVENKGVRSPELTVNLAESAPGLFTIGGAAQGAILNQDQTVNGTENGAAAGTIISLFATGEGLTNPGSIEGAITSADAPTHPILQVRVFIGGKEAEILYAGSAPGLPAGMLQVNTRVPLETPPGAAAPVVLTVGPNRSQDGVTVYVRP